MRFIVFDKYADILAQHQIEFPQYYPHPGCVSCVVVLDYAANHLNYLCCRWHEHDATEIQDHADRCIDEATKALEEAGWAKESIKAVGM